MMKFKLGWISLAMLLAGMTVTGCGGGSDSLASVNGDEITMEDFLKHLETKPTARVVVQGQTVEVPVANTMAFQALQDLVTQKLILQMAKDEGLDPTDQEIEEEIALKEDLDTNYVQNLQARGLTMEQIRKSIRVDLAQERILTKDVTVTDQEVDTFIKNNPNMFIKPALVEVVQIVVADTPSKNRADGLIQQGRDFQEVAREVNVSGANSSNQLNLSAMKQQQAQTPVVATLYKALTTTSPGSQTDWIRLSENQLVRYKVIRRTTEEKIEITNNRKLQVKRDLAKQKGAAAIDLNMRLAERLDAAEINVGASYLERMWDNFEENFGEAMKDAEAKKPGEGQPAGN